MQRAYNKITLLGVVIALLITMLFIEAFATPETMTSDTKTVIAQTAAQHVEIVSNVRSLNSLQSIQTMGIAVEKQQEQLTQESQLTQAQVYERASIIDTKTSSFVTTKTLSENDIVRVEPVYDANNKQIIERRSESMCLDIRSKSNWTYEDFDMVLNDEMKDLIPIALRLEDEVGINAIYIVAVGASETGWGKHMAGKYNYFNWTSDSKNHFNFETLEEFSDFSVATYGENYTDNTFYEDKLGFEPDHITLEVVNVKYALNSDKTTNWLWSNVVAEIMSNLSDRRLKAI